MTVKNTIALAAFATALSAYAFTVDSNSSSRSAMNLTMRSNYLKETKP